MRNVHCSHSRMPIPNQLSRYASRRLTRRLMRSMPWVGGAIALVTLASAMKKKGVIGGTVLTTLDFIPFVGALKNFAEWVRGRDFVPDKPPTGPMSQS